MLSKILKITAPIILILIILLIGYNSYKQVTKNTESPLNIIPTNAAVILQCNDANELYASLNDVDIWKHLCNISLVDSINNQIKEISSFYNQHPLIFKSNSVFISFHKVGANNSGLLFSSNFERETIGSNTKINTLLGKVISESQYNNESIFELQHKGNTLFVSFKGDIVFFSENKMLVEDAIRASVAKDKLSIQPSFSTAYKTISKSAEINLLFNYNLLIEYTNLFISTAFTTTDLSGWTATDLKLKNNIIIANGFGNIKSPVENYTDVFINQAIENTDIADIIPENTTILLALGFDNTKLLFDKKNKLLETQK